MQNLKPRKSRASEMPWTGRKGKQLLHLLHKISIVLLFTVIHVYMYDWPYWITVYLYIESLPALLLDIFNQAAMSLIQNWWQHASTSIRYPCCIDLTYNFLELHFCMSTEFNHITSCLLVFFKHISYYLCLMSILDTLEESYLQSSYKRIIF